MNAVELIGFFVTIAMIGFYILKAMKDGLDRRRNPEEYARRERAREANLRRLMKEIDPNYVEEEDEEEELQQPPSQAVKIDLQRRAASQISAGTQKPNARNKPELPPAFHKNVSSAGSYEVLRKTKSSRGMTLIKQQRSTRDMLILKEIFDKPLSMR